MSSLQLSTQAGTACAFLQDSAQLCPSSVLCFDPEPLGRCLPPLLSPWDAYCSKNTSKMVERRAEESFAPDLVAACTMDMMLSCLPAGLILQAAPQSHSIPSETLEAASSSYKSRNWSIQPTSGSLAVPPSLCALPSAHFSGFNKWQLYAGDGNWRWMLQKEHGAGPWCNCREIVTRASGLFLFLIAHVSRWHSRCLD